jgi:hypothetical protein
VQQQRDQKLMTLLYPRLVLAADHRRHMIDEFDGPATHLDGELKGLGSNRATLTGSRAGQMQ